jgi:hypothetical protein
MEMSVVESSARSVTAQVPYIRSDLDRVFVEFTARILGPDRVEQKMVEIRNGRAAAEPPSLEREGFQLVNWPSHVVRERVDELKAEKPVLQMPQAHIDYWDETIPLIRKLSGADEVLPVHASGVRFSARADRMKTHMTPAGWAHLDYDPDEAAVQLRETFEFNGREPRSYRRYVLYQGWRAITPPPQDFPLALCSGRTVAAEDIVPIDYHLNSAGRDVMVRSRGARFSPRHQWWYFPDMTLDEMLVFKGFDSDSPNEVQTLHTAFDDPTAQGATPRASVETRYFALYD